MANQKSKFLSKYANAEEHKAHAHNMKYPNVTLEGVEVKYFDDGCTPEYMGLVWDHKYTDAPENLCSHAPRIAFNGDISTEKNFADGSVKNLQTSKSTKLAILPPTAETSTTMDYCGAIRTYVKLTDPEIQKTLTPDDTDPSWGLIGKTTNADSSAIIFNFSDSKYNALVSAIKVVDPREP